MSLLSLALVVLLAPAAQEAPADDPVRVALYGRPVETPIHDLAAGPATHVGRAVRVRGRFQRGEADVYRLCLEQECLRAVPDEGLVMVLRARAPQWEGQEVEVTGVYLREQAKAADAEVSFAVRFWRVTTARASEAPALPGAPLTLESLVYAGGAHDGTLVRVRGRFRGQNLHGDLPANSQRGRDDWVIKDDYYAVWVTGRAAQGTGWRLDPKSMEDTRSWVEVSGRPETRKGYIYLRAAEVAPLAPPVAAEAVAPPPAQALARTPPPVVVFALPLETEDLPSDAGSLLIQFSKQMDPTSFAARVRLRYAGDEASFDPPRATYDAARRTLLVETGPLTPERDLECQLLEGIIDAHGQALIPRTGPIVSGVVDVLRYRVVAPASGASGG